MIEPTELIDDVVRQGALGVLQSAAELDEWDTVPTIVLVAEGPENPICIPVPIPVHVWLDVHPAAVMYGLTKGVTKGALSLELGDPVTPGDIRGVVLFTEGHAIDSGELTDAEKATLDDFKVSHRLEEHPKSRELRMATMMDRALTPALARHFRGKDVSDEIVYGIDGRLTAALSGFVTALLVAWIGESEKPNRHTR